jgi:hypothetical protein
MLLTFFLPVAIFVLAVLMLGHAYIRARRNYIERHQSPGQTDAPEQSDAKHWHERAEEARAIANQTEDGIARSVMVGIAFEYEKIASQAAAHKNVALRPRGAGRRA